MRHPEKGEAAAAAEVFTARVRAAGDGEDEIHVGLVGVDIPSGAMAGDTDPLLRVYGDLMDVGEIVADGGYMLTNATIVRIAQTAKPFEAILSMYLQGVALGVLMERARWE